MKKLIALILLLPALLFAQNIDDLRYDFYKNISIETNGGLAVNIQDQHSYLVGALMAQVQGSPMTLAASTVIDSYTVTMTTGHTFTAGDEFLVVEGDESFHALVVSVSVDVLTFNQPVDAVFTTSAVVVEVSSNLNVDGSSTPQDFGITIGGSASIELDITGMRIALTDSTAMDDGTFGGLTALTNGIVCQLVEEGIGKHNLWTAKTNGKLQLITGHLNYTDKAPAGANGINADWEVSIDNGVTIRLTPGDTLKIIIQDDLTGLNSFKIWVYGHLVTD